jgi:hypothetical protein
MVLLTAWTVCRALNLQALATLSFASSSLGCSGGKRYACVCVWVFVSVCVCVVCVCVCARLQVPSHQTVFRYVSCPVPSFPDAALWLGLAGSEVPAPAANPLVQLCGTCSHGHDAPHGMVCHCLPWHSPCGGVGGLVASPVSVGTVPWQVSLEAIESGACRESHPSARDRDRVVGRVVDIARRVRQEEFQATPSVVTCGLCPFQRSCPKAQQ